MIGFLRGRLAAKQPPQLLLDVGGVGYELDAPMSTFYELPALGEEVTLCTHLVVREDAHILFGFATQRERALFRELLKVSSVGPKLALSLLSGLSVDAFALCVEAQDVSALVRIPGVGRKTAERLLVEMRDRVKPFGDSLGGAATVAGTAPGVAGPQAEAFGALVALGYKPAEIVRLLKGVDASAVSTEDIIREALKSAVAR